MILICVILSERINYLLDQSFSFVWMSLLLIMWMLCLYICFVILCCSSQLIISHIWNDFNGLIFVGLLAVSVGKLLVLHLCINNSDYDYQPTMLSEIVQLLVDSFSLFFNYVSDYSVAWISAKYMFMRSIINMCAEIVERCELLVWWIKHYFHCFKTDRNDRNFTSFHVYTSLPFSWELP